LFDDLERPIAERDAAAVRLHLRAGERKPADDRAVLVFEHGSKLAAHTSSRRVVVEPVHERVAPDVANVCGRVVGKHSRPHGPVRRMMSAPQTTAPGFGAK
jgi:hypothetical protein